MSGKVDADEAYMARVDDLQKLDRQLASHEVRLKSTLREIELRREILGRRLRETVDKLIESKDTNALVPAD